MLSDAFNFLMLMLLMLNTANSGNDGPSVTISYQLSSQKCLDDGWTVWPLACTSRRCRAVDTQSMCDEILEPDEPLYKVSRHSVLSTVTKKISK